MEKRQAKTIIWEERVTNFWYGLIEDEYVATIVFKNNKFLLLFFDNMHPIEKLTEIIDGHTILEVKKIAQETLQIAINETIELLGFISESKL